MDWFMIGVWFMIGALGLAVLVAGLVYDHRRRGRNVRRSLNGQPVLSGEILFVRPNGAVAEGVVVGGRGGGKRVRVRTRSGEVIRVGRTRIRRLDTA